MLRKFANWLTAASHTVTVVVCLFVLVNFVAYFALKWHRPNYPDNLFNHVHWPESAAGMDVFSRLFKAEAYSQRLVIYKSSPSFAAHPSLHYVTDPAANPYFHMGVEGIRYESGWDDAKAKSLLGGSRKRTFAFGGSTMLGHGLKADETITAALNANPAFAEMTAFNFGSQAYDQVRELDKLVYLLRAGHCPDHVVLFDGWNDIAGWQRSNLRPVDRVVWHGYRVNRGDVAFTEGDSIEPNWARLAAESLPIMRLLKLYSTRQFTIDDVVADRDVFTQGFDFREAAFMFVNGAAYLRKHHERLRRQVVQNYMANLIFAHSLSKAFGFSLHAYYQPLGLLDPTNRFVPEAARRHPDYRFIEQVDQDLRAALAETPGLAADLSGVLAAVSPPRYIDVAHYAPAANRAIADRMARDITAANPVQRICGTHR